MGIESNTETQIDGYEDSEYDAPTVGVLVEDGRDNILPFRVSFGGESNWLSEDCLKVMVKTLNAALRARKRLLEL